jgi:phosphatidylinositol alpha-1,6-mannosyltransferase
MRELLVLSLDYPPNDGGISRLASGVVASLHGLGATLTVVTFGAGDRLGPDRPSSTVVEVSHLKGWRDLELMRQVRSFIRRNGRDAPILSTVWNPEATIALIAGGRRISILAHGNEVMPYGRPSLKGWLRGVILTSAHVVICNSRYTETLVKRVAPRSRTVVLNPAIDVDDCAAKISRQDARVRLGLPPSARIALTVARLDPMKGHETVIRAIAGLPTHEREAVVYVIVGKGEMHERLSELAFDLGVQAQVVFAGFVADEELPLWYRSADVFVLPSIVDETKRAMEGFGMALAEAQSLGVPVIGSRSGGIPDAVTDGEGGWLIDEGDTASLKDLLGLLVRQAEIFEAQGRLGAERIRRDLSWAKYSERLSEII